MDRSSLNEALALLKRVARAHEHHEEAGAYPEPPFGPEQGDEHFGEWAAGLVNQAVAMLDPDSKPYTVRIERDVDPMSPDDWENEDLFLVAFHRSFEVTRKGLTSPEDVDDWREKYAIFPLYAYIHGGVALSVGGFSCPWDSGQVGYVLVKKDAGFSVEGREGKDTPEARAHVAGLLAEEWNSYLGGDVWGYIIEDAEGEEVDSLWGIYGEDYARSEGEEALKHLNAERGFPPARETA